MQFLSELARWALFTLPGGPPINGYQETGSLVAGVVWTLRYEWLFYFLLPILALVVSHLGRTQVARVCLLTTGVLLSACGPTFIVFHFSSAFALPFFLGMLAAEANSVSIVRTFARNGGGTIVGIACLCVLLTCTPDIDLRWRAPFLVAFFLTVVAGNSYFSLLERRSSVLLGDASYSIYLLHGLVLKIIPAIFGLRFFAELDDNAGWLVLQPLASSIVVVAILNYRSVEAPFIRFGRIVLKARSGPSTLAKIAP